MSYNNRIENNNIDLQAILNIVKNLPEESGGSGGFYNGTKWTQSNITSGYFRCVYNANGVWVAGSNKSLYYSTDGKTWTRSNITSGSFYSIHNANGVWVAGSNVGLYYSVSWEAGT